MTAGPYPTKEMFEPIKRGTEGLYHVQNNGGGLIAYVPMYQLSSGSAVWVSNNDGSDGSPTPTPIKVLELSWQNVPVMFEALGLQTLNTETLTGADIEQLEIVALDANHPEPPYAGGWLPRQGNVLQIFSRAAQDRPEWVRKLENSAGGDTNVILALSEAFQALPLTGQTIRVTFTGQGTLKLKDGVGSPKTTSHPGVVVRALDAQGGVVAANLSATTMGRRTSGSRGFVEPENMPLRPAPAASPNAPEQGTEIVWPPDGTPYLHVFRRRSGGGVESYHLPLTAGLPQ